MNEISNLKNSIKEGHKIIGERLKYMDYTSLTSIIRWSAWINKDANKILDLQSSAIKRKEGK